ncbi:MAG: OmpA family protein [Deltaproteobacteria bacterium]|nr:OmpA family protein [Deltaproteobacteria bacterium]
MKVSIKATTKKPAKKKEVVLASANLGISSELVDQCMVRLADAGKAPRFDYDETDLMIEDRNVLDVVGRCVMTDGPLAGRALQLVGRADPRGTQEYNLALGNKRANAVEEYLVRMGVTRGQINITTRGDIDATGRDEVSWRNDRRVDLTLMEDQRVSSR